MGHDLRAALIQYKKYTLDLINCLEREDYDSLDGLLNMRQTLLDEFDNIEHTKEEFSIISNEIGILLIQKKLMELMNEKKSNVRKELDNVIESKKANKNYNRKLYSNAMFFSKEI